MKGGQRLFLMHLSLSEFCLTFLEMIKRIFYIIINSEDSITTEYISLIQFSSAAMVFYIFMIYLTADRFFVLYLSIRYPLYWSTRKTRILLITTWIVFLILTIVLSFLYKYQSIDYPKLFYIYIWPIIAAVFLVVAFGTYGYVIRKVYVHNKNASSFKIMLSRTNSHTNSPSIFKQPAFYVPTCLILTFVLLQVVPDLIIFFFLASGQPVSENVVNGVFVTYMISILLDAVIYIFISPYVKRMLIKKLICLKVFRKRDRNTSSIQTGATTIYDT